MDAREPGEEGRRGAGGCGGRARVVCAVRAASLAARRQLIYEFISFIYIYYIIYTGLWRSVERPAVHATRSGRVGRRGSTVRYRVRYTYVRSTRR
jgi:hypothetical protein